MRHFKHPNLLHLVDVLPVSAHSSRGEVYLVTPVMDWDLCHVIHKKRAAFTDSHVRGFSVQMLLGLLHLHSGHVVHRDIKPSNVFVHRNGLVKIADLGLSRGIDLEEETGEATHPIDEHLTEYVVTRWYRAPDVLLTRSQYGPPVDTWSVGCILYEMVTKQVLFPGKNAF